MYYCGVCVGVVGDVLVYLFEVVVVVYVYWVGLGMFVWIYCCVGDWGGECGGEC